MALTIYNSLTRKKEEFVSVQEGRVHIYVCGPTVYDYPHIGHAKSYVSFDVVVRFLRYLGYKVRYVQNITDVGHLLESGEDRILSRASRDKVEPMELVERYTRAYFEAMDALNVLRPDISPHAAAHIPEQIEIIERLLHKGHAYEANGSVYFDVSKWNEYGRLSGRKVEEQQAGARVEVMQEKRNPADFALWKKADPEHLMQWNSPWGRGFPGWHVECSAMSMKYLGETFDIHGGGMENQFPHHECEIAQSEAATGKPFAKYWMHNNMVLVNGIKMSKSLGNFTTVAEALVKYSGAQIRFFILQTHYRSPVDFSEEALKAAGQGLERLMTTYRTLQTKLETAIEGGADPKVEALANTHRGLFLQEMNDDFNSSAAIGKLFDYSRKVNKLLTNGTQQTRSSLSVLAGAFREMTEDILGLPVTAAKKELSTTAFIELLISLRNELRVKKEWQLSDFIRDGLAKNGIVLEDGKGGTSWRNI
jgi:cysteinyl-tRNA synthetase